MLNLLDNETTQSYTFRTKNWIWINDDRRKTYNTRNIRFKSTMLKSRFCDCSDPYILVKGIIIVVEERAIVAAIAADSNNKEAIIKSCLPFTACFSEIDNAPIDH